MMPVHSTNIIQGPDFAVKLIATMSNGQAFHGTGFALTHKGKDWLLTCRHNIELENFDFAGRNDLTRLEIVRHGTLVFGDNRRVVGVRINGRIADAVAIQLGAGEYFRNITPGFDTAIRISVKGANLPTTATIQGPAPERHALSLTPVGWVAFQGFAGAEQQSRTLRGAELKELPGFLYDWMIRFLPEPTPGFSGGPVLRFTDEWLSLLGITTHQYLGRFSAMMPDGQLALIEVPAGAAVPIAPLLAAMEAAPVGHSIADVAL